MRDQLTVFTPGFKAAIVEQVPAMLAPDAEVSITPPTLAATVSLTRFVKHVF